MTEKKVMPIDEVEKMMQRVLDEQNEKSLRDWFAGMAMQALVNAIQNADEVNISKWAYDHADAMLKERENG